MRSLKFGSLEMDIHMKRGSLMYNVLITIDYIQIRYNYKFMLLMSNPKSNHKKSHLVNAKFSNLRTRFLQTHPQAELQQSQAELAKQKLEHQKLEAWPVTP